MLMNGHWDRLLHDDIVNSTAQHKNKDIFKACCKNIFQSTIRGMFYYAFHTKSEIDCKLSQLNLASADRIFWAHNTEFADYHR